MLTVLPVIWRVKLGQSLAKQTPLSSGSDGKTIEQNGHKILDAQFLTSNTKIGTNDIWYRLKINLIVSNDLPKRKKSWQGPSYHVGKASLSFQLKKVTCSWTGWAPAAHLDWCWTSQRGRALYWEGADKTNCSMDFGGHLWKVATNMHQNVAWNRCNVFGLFNRSQMATGFLLRLQSWTLMAARLASSPPTSGAVEWTLPAIFRPFVKRVSSSYNMCMVM